MLSVASGGFFVGDPPFCCVCVDSLVVHDPSMRTPSLWYCVGITIRNIVTTPGTFYP